MGAKALRPCRCDTPMKFKDYYETLGIEREASQEEIKKAYRRLARRYHPDISKEKGDEERFKAVSEAYQTLSDPEKRKAYDELGRHRPGEEFHPPPEWDTRFRQGQPYQEVDLSELFEQMGFGASQRRQAGGGDFPIRGHDVEAVARLSLDEVCHGTQVTLEKPEGGRVRIRVPKGVVDGERLRIPGRGGAGRGGAPAGDVYLKIELLPHPLFRPVGHDLYLELPLAPWEAALGAEIEIPTLEGRVTGEREAWSAAGAEAAAGRQGTAAAGGGRRRSLRRAADRAAEADQRGGTAALS